MKDEIKVNKANKSLTFINNGIAFSQFGVADEILDLITNLQEELKSANESITWYSNRFKAVERDNERLKKDLKTLWNVCWNNDTEMTSYQNEVFDNYYDMFHKNGGDEE